MESVLVVDDEEDIRELVGIYIKNEGYQVYKAANGKDALDIIDNMSIDITILDVMMADMDGITLCMEIRKKSNIPIIKAQLRRYKDFNNQKQSNILEYLDLTMNIDTHRVFLPSKEILLTPKEFAILELLWKNKGNVFSTEHIYDMLWSEEEAYDINNVIMVHIRNIRSKIETDLKNPKYIKTVWGVGYKFS